MFKENEKTIIQDKEKTEDQIKEMQKQIDHVLEAAEKLEEEN